MPIRAFLAGAEREGFTWPLGDVITGGGLPSIPAWRQWGHSWAAGGYDVPYGETEFSARLAGVLGVPGAFYGNYGINGSSLMDDHDGFGYYLKNTTKDSGLNVWPWEPYHGIDGFFFGVNDFSTRMVTGMITGGPDPWPTQRDMWREVWRECWRSVIQRSIAGGVFPGERGIPTNINTPTTGNHPTVTFGGTWSWRALEGSGTGVWQTTTSGATVTITVPADYDTGYIAVRHVVPGSYFPGAQTIYGADGTGPYTDPPGPDPPPIPQAGLPAIVVGSAASETFLAPATITTATAGVTSVVRSPRILRNRRATSQLAVNNHVALVDRIAAPITPGTTRTVTITVGTIPAQGWYAFDSWEIEAKQVNRPPVVVADLPPPAWWVVPFNFLGVNTWAAMNTTAQLASDDVASVCAEWADPGICVAEARAALVGHELDYGVLYPAGVTPATGGGLGTAPMVGDGTHPHSIGGRLIAGAYRDALVKAALPASRYAQPFAPDRDMVRA